MFNYVCLSHLTSAVCHPTDLAQDEESSVEKLQVPGLEIY